METAKKNMIEILCHARVAADPMASLSVPNMDIVRVAEKEFLECCENVWGNRPLGQAIKLGDMKLVFVAVLKRAIQIIEQGAPSGES